MKYNLGAPKRREPHNKKISALELESAKKRLDEGRDVELESDSSFDAPAPGSAHLSATNGVRNEDVAAMPEFDSTSSSILDELKVILDGLNESQSSQSWEGSDPDVTNFLLGLISDTEDTFPSPFHLADSVRRRLISMAEEAGARALSWDISQYNKIGGKGTLNSVWSNLKSDEKVRGRKRSLKNESSDENESKKLKISLNLSDACEKMGNIELSNTGDDSMVASMSEKERERTDESFQAESDAERHKCEDLTSFSFSVSGTACNETNMDDSENTAWARTGATLRSNSSSGRALLDALARTRSTLRPEKSASPARACSTQSSIKRMDDSEYDELGCNRATLRPQLEAGDESDHVSDELGCNRATLRPQIEAGDDNGCVSEGVTDEWSEEPASGIENVENFQHAMDEEDANEQLRSSENENDSDLNASHGDLFMSSDSGSMPNLASSEYWTSEAESDHETDHDSGVSDSQAGNVTDLSRRRRIQEVRTGVITETGPYIPVSLGLSFCEPENDFWEEVLDDDGNPTGVERLSFRFNRNDGRTESIDDDLSNVLRLNGMPDGTNCRRVVDVDGEVWREYGGLENVNDGWEVTDENSTCDDDITYQLDTTNEQMSQGRMRGIMCERYYDDEVEIFNDETGLSSSVQRGCMDAIGSSSSVQGGFVDTVRISSVGVQEEWERGVTGELRGSVLLDEMSGIILWQVWPQLLLWAILGVMVLWHMMWASIVGIVTSSVNSPRIDNRAWGECGATLGGGTSGASCLVFQQVEAQRLNSENIGNSRRKDDGLGEMDSTGGRDGRIHGNDSSCQSDSEEFES